MAKSGNGHPKSEGKQGVVADSDFGGHAAYGKTQGPASSKQGVSESTPYKKGTEK